MDDEPYLATMQDMGIPVFPDQRVADWELDRGARVLGCLWANRVGDDAYEWAVAHHPDLTPEDLEAVCEEAAKRFVDFAANAGPGEMYSWIPRSDGGYEVWLVEHLVDPTTLS